MRMSRSLSWSCCLRRRRACSRASPVLHHKNRPHGTEDPLSPTGRDGMEDPRKWMDGIAGAPASSGGRTAGGDAHTHTSFHDMSGFHP